MRRVFFALLVVACLPALAQTAPLLRVTYSAPNVSLFWTPVAGAQQYLIRRADVYSTWNHTLPAPNVSATSEQVAANSAYVYQVIAEDLQGQQVGLPSNLAIVTTYPVTDLNLIAGTTRIKSQHVKELRTSVNAVRVACAVAPATWTNSNIDSALISRYDIADLRAALGGALAGVGLSPQAYVDPTLDSTIKVRAVHVEELRARIQAFPQWVSGSLAVSERYFSPNADGQKDTTTLSGMLGSSAFNQLQLNIRNAAGTIVRTFPGSGPSFSFTWDGRNSQNMVQPDGDYTAELVDLEGIAAPVATVTVTVDVGAPQAAITSPPNAQTVSNIQTNGGGDLAVYGSTTDAHFGTWLLEQTGNNQANSTIASGTSAVTPANVLGTWHTLAADAPLPNGLYTLRLTSTDQAGNSAVATVGVTVAHFSASLNAYEINLGSSGTVTYTSMVPYSMSETVTIKSAAGNVVRTLVNQTQRAAGSYVDAWDGLDDHGQLVIDGIYKVYATLSDGAHSYVWDRSSVYRNTIITNFSYPQCINDAGTAVDCDHSTITFDPFANKPLHIVYCNYGTTGEPRGQCNAYAPVLVQAKVATPNVENDGVCDSSTCFFSAFQSGGLHDLLWYGYSMSGAYVAGTGGLVFMRRDDSFPRNQIVAFGTAPAISKVMVKHPMFDPWFGSESVDVYLTTFGGRSVTLSATFRNLASGSVLRTLSGITATGSPATLTWDGRADNNDFVAPGVYEIAITVTDSAGSSTTVKPVCLVRY